MEVKINPSWKRELAAEFAKDYFKKLAHFIHQEYQQKKVYPAPENIFRAFDLCPFDQVKVVILGQDPYHEAQQAQGLAFSVKQGIQNPPSLVNIYQELKNDLGVEVNSNGDLSSWAQQGVLLLNATLTVVAKQAGSHQHQGWEEFTDQVIQILSARKDNLVFILWGAYARSKKELIDSSRHLILQAPHPSPLSAYRGFFGSRPFSQTNQYLREQGQKEIAWDK